MNRSLNTPTAKQSHGFGLGLRTAHYNDFLTSSQDVDWLEIITDNFLVDGGKPLVTLEKIRRDYPMAMHGVAMSIGASEGVDLAYLKKVKALADRIDPMWVSDHLCWIGHAGAELHDLYPLPYTDEAARHVITQIQRAQDVLQRKLVLENVSSYIDFKASSASEWQFLSYVAQTADCELLVDVNNIYVSSVNHGFDPLTYLRALPVDRVRQIHLAGHSDNGDYIIDTHDHPVSPAVWALYSAACQRFGAVATMIERDDHIPPLVELIAELAMARDVAAAALNGSSITMGTSVESTHASAIFHSTPANELALTATQSRLKNYVLDRPDTSPPLLDAIKAPANNNSAQRLNIYKNAYSARLVEVLVDSFAKTYLYMGSDAFEADTAQFVLQHPPTTRSLSRYGAALPDFFRARYPGNPELAELAQLDWDLRTRFDGADVAALDPATAQQLPNPEHWLSLAAPLHPSMVLRAVTTNVASIWRAIDADADVPELEYQQPAKLIAVWRKGLQPHFQTLDADEAAFISSLAAGQSINTASVALQADANALSTERLGGWLTNWLLEGWLRVPELMPASP